jgi:formate dehydrogenase iron-sulfur subunit
MSLDRRQFIKLSGLGIGGTLLSLRSARVAEGSGAEDEVAILYDTTRCVGCRACQNACKDWNKNLAEPDSTGLYDAPKKLSAHTWTLIKVREEAEPTDWPFFNYQCMHCTEAACVTVCPTGALFKDERGFVALDKSMCNGCGYCTQFCPFGVPHLGDVNLVTGKAKSNKCTFCQDRVWAGIGGPFCAEHCPTEALTWGKRKVLLAQAKARVSDLKAQGFDGATLYGENEAGGLHRLSILLDSPAAYALPADPQGPITFADVWRKIIQPLGEVAFGATVLAITGAFLIIRRNVRMEEVE